jgi:glucokinase
VPQRSSGRFPDTRALIEAYLVGDAEASRVWLRSVRDLAAAVASFINLFDPQAVVLAGGIATAGAALTGPLEEHLEHWEYRPGGSRVPIVLAELGEYAGAVGAAHRALMPEPD